nr:MAG TPA: hypothetical protein [Caudoviricetes sp.]
MKWLFKLQLTKNAFLVVYVFCSIKKRATNI